MNTESTFKSQTLKFKDGEEFDEETPDGRKVKSVITFDGNKMTHKSSGEKPTVIERTFGDKEMTAVSFYFLSLLIYPLTYFDFTNNFFSLSFTDHEG